MSLGFIIFQEKPSIMKTIDDELNKVEQVLTDLKKSCCPIAVNICSNAVYKRLDEILENVDAKIGSSAS